MAKAYFYAKNNDRFQDYRQVDQSNGKIMRRIICILITQQYVHDEREDGKWTY